MNKKPLRFPELIFFRGPEGMREALLKKYGRKKGEALRKLAMKALQGTNGNHK